MRAFVTRPPEVDRKATSKVHYMDYVTFALANFTNHQAVPCLIDGELPWVTQSKGHDLGWFVSFSTIVVVKGSGTEIAG